jgi:hypothetical protein
MITAHSWCLAAPMRQQLPENSASAGGGCLEFAYREEPDSSEVKAGSKREASQGITRYSLVVLIFSSYSSVVLPALVLGRCAGRTASLPPLRLLLTGPRHWRSAKNRRLRRCSGYTLSQRLLDLSLGVNVLARERSDGSLGLATEFLRA